MGKIGEEYVTIEEFVDGNFRKYVNSNGNDCCKGDRSALFEKAECLAHFTYERSKKEVMLLDIQGCEYSLIDPEIASKELNPMDLLFRVGNRSANAISTFVQIISAAVTVNCWGFLHWRDKLFSSPILTQT